MSYGSISNAIRLSDNTYVCNWCPQLYRGIHSSGYKVTIFNHFGASFATCTTDDDNNVILIHQLKLKVSFEFYDMLLVEFTLFMPCVTNMLHSTFYYPPRSIPALD